MQGPAIFIFIFSILYLIGIYTGYRDRKKGGLQIFFWCLISLVIYIIGVNYFYGEVRNASTHGNTVHGWYSKSNGGEKAIAILWGIFFPILTNSLVFLFVYKRLEKEEKRKKKSLKPKIEIVANNNLDILKKETLPKTESEWWYNLDDNWKKTINFHIGKSNIRIDDKDSSKEHQVIDSTKLQNHILNNCSTEKPNSSEYRRIENLKEFNSYLDNLTINDISFISNFKSLEKLSLSNLEIQDIEPLRQLSNLKELRLSSNNIENLEPLMSLTKLEELSLSDNKITDINSLKYLGNLKNIALGNNQIKSISALQNLYELVHLHLNDNLITDLQHIKKLTYLKTLSINGNLIIQLPNMTELISLNTISLYDNPIENFEALKELRSDKIMVITKENQISYQTKVELENELNNCMVIYNRTS